MNFPSRGNNSRFKFATLERVFIGHHEQISGLFSSERSQDDQRLLNFVRFAKSCLFFFFFVYGKDEA